MQAFGAAFVVPLEANRTSNFAVPITKEWVEHGGSLDDVPSQQEIYCQVDVHVCADQDEWDRIVFFHGFGDLGMILGLIARNCGFSLSTKGLKVGRLIAHISLRELRFESRYSELQPVPLFIYPHPSALSSRSLVYLWTPGKKGL